MELNWIQTPLHRAKNHLPKDRFRSQTKEKANEICL